MGCDEGCDVGDSVAETTAGNNQCNKEKKSRQHLLDRNHCNNYSQLTAIINCERKTGKQENNHSLRVEREKIGNNTEIRNTQTKNLW